MAWSIYSLTKALHDTPDLTLSWADCGKFLGYACCVTQHSSVMAIAMGDSWGEFAMIVSPATAVSVPWSPHPLMCKQSKLRVIIEFESLSLPQ